MKWRWNNCPRREEASLLAANILSREEKIVIEYHLSECAQCRAYYNELIEVAAPLAGWEKSFSSIEPSQAMRTRWANAVKEQAATSFDNSRSSNSIAGFFIIVWRELIWPSRRVWSGLAVLWAVMLLVNARLSHSPKGASASSPQEILQAWEEQKRVFAEWDRPSVIVQAAPAYVPNPRS